MSRTSVRTAALLWVVLLIRTSFAGNSPTHLQCHRIKDDAPKTSYSANLFSNQPGIPAASGCVVKVPAKLVCAHGYAFFTPTPPGDSTSIAPQTYLCYKLKCPKVQGAVALSDQFGAHGVQVKAANMLCVPAVGTPTTTTTTTTLPLPQGAACSSPGECQTGNCVDGVCCDQPCDLPCQACTASTKGGGVDGECGSIAEGTDPDGECAAQSPESCGTTGDCDGLDACALHSPDTECGAAYCTDESVENADFCDGVGNCVDGGATYCNGYACSGNACLTSCSGESGCASDYTCDEGVCNPT